MELLLAIAEQFFIVDFVKQFVQISLLLAIWRVLICGVAAGRVAEWVERNRVLMYLAKHHRQIQVLISELLISHSSGQAKVTVRVVGIHFTCKRHPKLTHVLRMLRAGTKVVGHEWRLAHQTKQILGCIWRVNPILTTSFFRNVSCNFIVHEKAVKHRNGLVGLRTCWWSDPDPCDMLSHILLQIKVLVPDAVLQVGTCLLFILH